MICAYIVQCQLLLFKTLCDQQCTDQTKPVWSPVRAYWLPVAYYWAE